MVTLAGLASDRRAGMEGSVRQLSQELNSLAKEVANVGRVVLLQADSPAARENADHMKAAREHFDHMKSTWSAKVRPREAHRARTRSTSLPLVDRRTSCASWWTPRATRVR